MRKFPLSYSLLWMVSVQPGLEAATVLVNGEFAGSLSGWTAAGAVFNTGDAAVLSDVAPAPASIFQSGVLPEGVVSLTLTFDYLNGLSPAVAGGFLRDSIFATLYGGGQPFGSTLSGGVYEQAVGLFDMDSNGVFNVAAGASFGPSPKGTGWTRYTLTQASGPGFTGPGYATVAFESYNLNGIGSDSVAAVDNVSLIAVVPEPGQASLLLLSAATLLRRRRLPTQHP
jgi:hypothetical protein